MTARPAPLMLGISCGAGGPRWVCAFPGDGVLVGRATAADLCLPAPAVSLVHLRIRRRADGGVEVEDAGSTNGTRLDGARIPPGVAVPLRPDGTLEVGPYLLTLEEDGGDAGGVAGPEEVNRALAAAAAPGEADGAAPALRHASLTVLGSNARLLLCPREAPYVVGRGPDCDLRLDDPDASRRHVTIACRGRRRVARDAGSKNGARLNGRPLLRPTRLQHGDLVRIGGTTLRFDDPATATAPPAAPPDRLPPWWRDARALALAGVVLAATAALIGYLAW